MRAAIYRRVSSDKQAQENKFSLQEQTGKTHKYCKEKGYEIVADLEEVFTGSLLEERPQMSRLIDMMYGREIDVVVSTTLDRLSREQNHLGVIHHIASKHRVSIELTEESYEDTPAGRLMRSHAGFFAEVERAKIKERTQRGVRQRVRSGLMLVGYKPLYGYSFADAQKSRYIENPDTAPIVRRIFQAVAAGGTQRGICFKLTQEGIPTPQDYLRMQAHNPSDPPRGASWAKATIWKILQTPAYWGQHSAFHKEIVAHTVKDPRTGQERTRHFLRDNPIGEKRIMLPDAAPALVSMELVEEVRRRLEENRKTASRNNKNPERGLLRAGYVKCGVCGSNLTLRPYINKGKRGTVTSYQYFCSHMNDSREDANRCQGVRVAIHKLDHEVWQHITRFLRDPSRVAVESDSRPEHQRHEEILDGYHKELKDIEKRETNTRKAIQLMGEDDVAGLVADLKTLGTRKSQLRQEIQALENEQATREQTQARMQAVQLWVSELDRKQQEFAYQEKRAILYGCNICVTVYRHESRGTVYKVVAGRHGEAVLFDGTTTLWSTADDCGHDRLKLCYSY